MGYNIGYNKKPNTGVTLDAFSSQDDLKKWFGDWENTPENASKVVDKNGEPLVMYHSSPTAGIRKFEMHKALYGIRLPV